jgi:hypothetical protein
VVASRLASFSLRGSNRFSTSSLTGKLLDDLLDVPTKIRRITAPVCTSGIMVSERIGAAENMRERFKLIVVKVSSKVLYACTMNGCVFV